MGSLLYSLYKIPLAQACFHSPHQIFTHIGERASASFPACFIQNINFFIQSPCCIWKLRSQPHLPGANELINPDMFWFLDCHTI